MTPSHSSPRVAELDYARTFACLMLPFIHCFIECTSEEGLTSGIPYLFDTVIGGPLAAPMYIFCMGFCVCLPNHSDARILFRRGIRLELTALVFNLCRYTVPYLIGYGITGNAVKFIEPLLYRTFCTDILQFAGLYFLVMSLLVKLRCPTWAMLGIALAASLVGTALNGIDFGTPLRNILGGYFVGTEDPTGATFIFSDFPLLNWMLVPVTGFCWAHLYKRRNLKKIYRFVTPLCLAVTVCGFYTGIVTERGMFGQGENCYYHISTPDCLLSIVAAIALLGVYRRLASLAPRWLGRFCQTISRGVTAFYCFHWILVVVITDLILYCLRGTQELSVGWTAAVSAFICVVSCLYTVLFVKRKYGE